VAVWLPKLNVEGSSPFARFLPPPFFHPAHKRALRILAGANE